MAACSFGCSDDEQCCCSEPLDFESKPYNAFALLAACPFGCSDDEQCCCSQPLDSDTQIDSQVQDSINTQMVENKPVDSQAGDDEHNDSQVGDRMDSQLADPTDTQIVDSQADEPQSAQPLNVDLTSQFATDQVCLKVI